MLGSLTVETPDGVRFKIGTGFTDKERKKPPPMGSLITYKYRTPGMSLNSVSPPMGSLITYKYRGFTKTGKPKFPSFWRVREEN